MKKILLSIFSSLFFLICSATTFTTTSNGNWNDANSWDVNGSPGNYWGANDIVIVNHDLNLNVNIGFAGTLNLNGNSSIVGNSRNITLNNGASFTSNGEISVKNLTLNSSSTAIHFGALNLSNNLTVGSGSTLTSNAEVNIGGKLDNNGGTIIANDSYTVSGNLTNNNGIISFNDSTSIGGKFDNNNSNSVININGYFDVTGNITNNSSATINVAEEATVNTSGNFTNNSGSEVNNNGKINATGNFNNNGGSFNNEGIFDLDGNFTQNGGKFSNNGGMIVDGNFRINGSGTVNGNGVLRVDNITNFGTFNGSVDICRQDDSTPTSLNGGGNYNANLTYCEVNSSAALPIVLKEFSGEFVSKTTIEVKWVTSSEINNDYFTLFYSENGENFLPTKSIYGAGNSNTELTYKTTIDGVYSNKVYVQLKQTDFDGRFEVFDPIIVKKDLSIKDALTEQIALYPNPGSGKTIFVEFENFTPNEYQIHVLSENGKLLVNQELIIEEGISYAEIELLKGVTLNKGLHFIRISSSDTIISRKYIVY